MATIAIKVPKGERDYKLFLTSKKIKVIRDYNEVSRPIIYQHDGIQSNVNQCKLHVVKIHSIPSHDYYIVIAANKMLTFNQIVVNFSLFTDCMIGHPQEIEDYYKTNNI